MVPGWSGHRIYACGAAGFDRQHLAHCDYVARCNVRTMRELSITGYIKRIFKRSCLVRAGRKIAFVSRKAPNEQRGRVWIVTATGGPATPVTADSVQAQAPTFSADGRRMAYFAPDSDGRPQVSCRRSTLMTPAKGSPIRLTNHTDVTSTRIRWVADGRALLYSADGRLWKVIRVRRQTSGNPVQRRALNHSCAARAPQARFPEPGHQESARGFMGLALSPDGREIGVLALGKLWTIPVGGSPRAVADVPFEATSLAWSPDGAEVAWSAGAPEQEDLFATSLKTGVTRRVTSLPGRETFPAYSPDGRQLAFVHLKDDGVLRVIDAKAGNVADIGQTRDLRIHRFELDQYSAMESGVGWFAGVLVKRFRTNPGARRLFRFRASVRW